MSIHPQHSMQLTGANASVVLRPGACRTGAVATLWFVISGGYQLSGGFVGGLLGASKLSNSASDCAEEGPS